MGKYAAEYTSVLADIKAAGTSVPMTYVPAAAPGTVNPVTDLPTTPTPPRTVPVPALILPGPSQPNFAPLSGTWVQANSRTLYIAGKGCPLYEIPRGTVFTFQGHTWTALGDSILDPDSSGQCLLHTVLVER